MRSVSSDNCTVEQELAKTRFSSLRAACVLVLLSAALVALAGRVAWLQTIGRQKTILKAERQQYQSEVLAARRGGVFDCNGVLMAGTVQNRSLYADPAFVLQQYQTEGRSLVQMDEAIGRLARLIDQEPFELSRMLAERAESRFVILAENVDDATAAAIGKLNMPGIGFTPSFQRYYPMGSLAAHVLGDCGADGQGLEGLEMKFQDLLAGKPGYKKTLKTARRQGIAVAADDYLPPLHGHHLILTIDSNIQMIAEQELAEVCQKNKAKRGEVIVMDPRNGDVLALANWPTFNPQNIEDSTDELRRNNCLVAPMEPGSAIKPFLVGPALQQRITRPEEMWPIPGISWITSYGRRITDVHGYGKLSMWDVLVKSSNIGMCMLGERMGNTRLYQALNRFGFGRTTGLELPGEDPGLLRPLAKWSHFSTDSVSQGYELMVTPLQLARAFCAYANGGRLPTPRLIKGVLDERTRVVSLQADRKVEMMPEAIDPITAAQIKRILCDVVVRGTATKARSRVWNILGKTGTAHISEGKAGYSATRFNSTFLGAGPAENPRLVVCLAVHEPDRTIAHYGGTVAAPGAGKLLERALAYLQVPSSPDLPEPPPNIASVLYAYNAKLYRIGATTSARE